MSLEWDPAKRQSNLDKHGLDFVDANLVLDNQNRWDIKVEHQNEKRTQSLAYVYEVLSVLSLVHTERGTKTRIISFRPASKVEREAYHEWLDS